MSNANFITQFEYKLNNLTGSETQAELLALRATSDKHPTLDVVAVALLDAAITVDANTLNSASTIKELVTVGNANADKKTNGLDFDSQEIFTASGSFIVPLGVTTVYVTGCAGGGGGGAGYWHTNPGNYLTGGGGAGGQYVVTVPLRVTPLSTINITIGAGGPSNSGDGGNTYIGDSLTLLGGGGGFNSGRYYIGSGVYGNTYGAGGDSLPANVDIYKGASGASASTNGAEDCGRGFIGGAGNGAGGGGLFGLGGNYVPQAAQSPLPNSGAGGSGGNRLSGGAVGALSGGAPGGSGKVVIDWELV